MKYRSLLLVILCLIPGLSCQNKQANEAPAPVQAETEPEIPVPPEAPVSPLEAAIQNARSLAAQNQFDDALLAIQNAEIKFGTHDDLNQAFDQIYDQHPDYNADMQPLVNDVDVTAIKKLGGGSSLVYRLIKDKQTFAAFKPLQSRKQTNPRAEIAAYRLCPLMRCRFDIPKNTPVSFEYRQFSGLYARIPSNPNASEEFKDLTLTRQNDQDLVTGTMKTWIPDYADFPIEYEDIWLPWFALSKDELKNHKAIDSIEAFVAKNHSERAEHLASKLKKHLADASAYDIALQISNMLVLDLLTNNWDRYSSNQAFYGVNCQIANQRFVSIDNGAAFSQTVNPKPRKHVQAIQRFSRITVEAIRAWDHDRTLERLFPNATSFDRERFETFWAQRQYFLNTIDQLVAQNGEEQTLFFE